MFDIATIKPHTMHIFDSHPQSFGVFGNPIQLFEDFPIEAVWDLLCALRFGYIDHLQLTACLMSSSSCVAITQRVYSSFHARGRVHG